MAKATKTPRITKPTPSPPVEHIDAPEKDEARAEARAKLRAARIRAQKEEARAAGTYEQHFPTAAPALEPAPPADPPLPLMAAQPASEPEPVAEGILATLAHEINVRMALAAKHDASSNDHRLAAAIQMAAAKAACEDARIPFRRWAEAHLSQAFESVRHMARIGSSDNPQLALEDWRRRNAAHNRNLRVRKALAVTQQPLVDVPPAVAAEEPVAPTPEPALQNGHAHPNPVDHLLSEFDHMPAAAQTEFLQRAAERLGALVELPNA